MEFQRNSMKYIPILFTYTLASFSCTPMNLPDLGVITGGNQGTSSSKPRSIPSIPDLINKQYAPARPKLKRLTNGHYTVLENWRVNVSGKKFIVQKDYTSNGITAPQSIKNMLGDNVNAPETWTAVFHDWCFTQKNLTRLECDDLYIQLMKDFNISARKIQLMGATVKGYSIYKGN